jgi:alkylhydroperoxidase family enzyme
VRALCEYAVRLTRDPSRIGGGADALRAAGVTDAEIHDAIQVIAYFNYINRVAEGVGVENEPDWL